MMDDSASSSTKPHQSSKWKKTLVLFLQTTWICASVINGELYDTEGPQFTQEPSRSNYFTNVQGLVLHCSAKGPHVQVQWMAQDGQALQSYSGIREIFSNGTIFFAPFPVSFYRPDVHDASMYCLASNAVGKIRSRNVHVRAVINERFEVHVEDAQAYEGSDVLLRCLIPDAVKDFVSVTSWTKDDSFNIFPHSGAGGRYFMTPSGELLIEEVTRNDSVSTFRCRTVNRLTGETQLSENAGRFRLQLSGGPGSKSKSESPPRINKRVSKLNLKEGEVAVLLCISDGWPLPSHWWMRSSGVFGGFEALRPSERVKIRKSAVIIENVRIENSGGYFCVANNSVSSDRHQIDLVVASSPLVQVVPSVQTADVGGSAEFTCWTNSPEEASQGLEGRQVVWRKDGIEIRPNLRLSVTPSGDKLRIANVQKEDIGMYQCFAFHSQGTAQLRLGDAAPQLLYRFIEQTLRPGPAVSLKCSAIANPTPSPTWFLDGFPIPHSERFLVGQYTNVHGEIITHVNITSAQVEDGGEYSCLFENRAGKVSHSARLNIYGPPVVRPMPATITAVAGKDFKIRCPTGGWPIESTFWEKDGQVLPFSKRHQLSSDGGALTIKDVDRSDAGHLFCTATGREGQSDRKGVVLKVVVPPKIVPFSFPEGAKEGEKLFATCVVSSGDVPVRLQWLKNSQVVGDTEERVKSFLPSLSTHRIGDSDALVLQITHLTSRDSSNYSCKASNSGGEVVHTAQLVVHVPPKIFMSNFPSQVSQGTRLQAVCSVEQGDIEDTNLTVTWLKDSYPLSGTGTLQGRTFGTTTANFVKVVHVDAYSAMLIIERVEREHSGNYSCKIKNSVEEVSSTVPLVVRVPPKWVVEPKEAEVTEGNSLIAHCQSEGYPTPKISWKRGIGNRPENYRDIPIQSGLSLLQGGGLSSTQEGDIFSMGNGTLIIRSARKAHQGFYLCEVSNGVGSGLSKVIRFTVNVPVQVKGPVQNVTSRVGGKAVLRCEIAGDGPVLQVVWKKGMNEILPDIDSRFHFRLLNKTEGGMVTEMIINNVAREDTSSYSCTAVDPSTRSQGSLWLFVQEPPPTPRNLHVVSKGSRFVRLGWVQTTNGNSPITQFIIKYKTGSSISSPDGFHEVKIPGQIFSETVGNLRPGRRYTFLVVAENSVGHSEQSEALEVRTDNEAPEQRPSNVRVAAVSSTDIMVTWQDADSDTWHGELLGYYVGFKKFREGEQYEFNTIERREEGLQEYQIKGLDPFTSYDIVVQAYNSIGSSPLADPVVATTLEDAPSTGPDGLQCSSLTSQSLQLSWNPLSQQQARGVVKGYKVLLEKTDFDLQEMAEPSVLKSTQSTNLVVSNLGKYQNYSVQVQASTVAGHGPFSPPHFCQTEEDVPSSPSAIRAVVNSPSSITVTWLPPSSPNGILTKYTVSIAPAETGKGKDVIKRKRQQVPPETFKHQFDGLRAEEKYEIKVSAFTRVGEGPHILSQILLTRNVQSAITSFGLEFRIVWKTDVRLPCETVGNPTTQWTRYAESVRDTDRISGGHDGSLLIRNARREDGGNYTCSIESKGLFLDSITHRLLVQVPPMGPLLNAAVNSHSSLSLQWKATDNGNAAIRGYILHYKEAEGEWLERQISRHLTSYELRDLKCGTEYQLYLTAYNRAGMGQASDPLTKVSTLGSSPSLSHVAPQFMVETNQTWARVLLRDVWTSNGCPILKFQVFYKESDSFHWQAVGAELDGESHSVDLVGLKGGTRYQVKAIAANSAGSQAEEITIHTSHGVGAETNKIMNHLPTDSTPLYMDVKLIIPTVLSLLGLIVVACGAVFCLLKKNPGAYRSTDHLSIGTSSSSTYFKHNPRNPQQVYMTVKKSTPSKGVDMPDTESVPQYSDDIYPYATFELESRRDSQSCNPIPTLDRRRSSNQAQWGQNMIYQEPHGKPPRHSRKQEESDEYDSCGSDTDTEREIRQGGHRSSIPIHNAMPNRLSSKFQDYDSHVRHGSNSNRYEFVAPTRQMQSEIHGLVIADAYSFNDAIPTIEGRRKKPNRRRSQGYAQPQQVMYETSEFVDLDPPYGFKDAREDHKREGRRSNSIAV